MLIQFFTPMAQLQANQTIVNQLQHSDEAYLLNHYIGSGSWIVVGIVILASLVSLFWVWKNRL